MPAARPRLLSALLFSPRGGSAHVARALAGALPAHGWDVTVVAGSRRGEGDARRFFRGLDVRPVGFDAALAAADPLAPPPGVMPMHPSYEDRPGAPDRVFAALDGRAFERQTRAWMRVLVAAGAAHADALHLHHLTPLHEAAARVAPGVPVVGHLHGTELLMLEAIEAGPPAGWVHAEAWALRLRGWAQGCRRLVLLSTTQVDRAERLLGVDRARLVVLPNGFEPARFVPSGRPVDRHAVWRRHLVDAPRGWEPGGEPGGVRYRADELAALADGVVVLGVGRFTAVKRVPLLIEAFVAARARAGVVAGLVLVGGHPGEWEGEHPLDAVARLHAEGVFLAGWHDHDTLPELLHAADLLALASVREQFGAVLVEGMACALPAVAVDRLGPGEIVEDGRTGWLVEPDDLDALTGALAHALGDGEERARRGAAARHTALARYTWPALAGRLAGVLDDVVRDGALALGARSGG